jgi:hypothetical protein
LPEAGAARPQRTPWILAAAISLVATAGAARLAAPVLLGQPTSGEVAVAPAAPAAEQLSASVDAARRTAEPVTITVRATPENATLSIDGGPELPLPHTISTVPDARPHLLEVRAPKHAPLTQSVVFDKSQTLVLELSSAQRTPHAAPRYRGSAPVMAANASRPQAEAPAAPAAAEPAADEFAQPLQKRARKPIDEADPFKE